MTLCNWSREAMTSPYPTLRRDPALLERRMRGGPTAEKRPAQRLIMLATSLGFIAILVVAVVTFFIALHVRSGRLLLVGRPMSPESAGITTLPQPRPRGSNWTCRQAPSCGTEPRRRFRPHGWPERTSA